MKIVRPYAKLLRPWASYPWALKLEDVKEETALASLSYIEWCGRISHRSEELQTSKSWNRFIEFVVMQHGDWSIVEHVTASVDCLVDRGITHEIVRHRLFSYTQESTRFVNYEKKMPPSFIYPKPDVECSLCLSGAHLGPEMNRQRVHGDGTGGIVSCSYETCWLEAIENAEDSYRILLSKGWRPQEARSVFPNALASRIIITGNLRNWRHFFIMRTTAEAHPQMRQVMIPLLAEFKSTFPILFDDIEPNVKQSEGMKKAR